MTRKEWQEIRAAADLFGLGEKATLAEIKKAYRRMSKKYHPDVQQNKAGRKTGKITMHEITEAFQVLLDYCARYRIPLKPGENEPLDGADWWFERFGQDHLWGKGSPPKGDG